MEKVNIELPQINKNLRWKVSVTLTGDHLQKNNGIEENLCSKFEFKGSLYTRICPRYALVIEIKTPKQETFNFENNLFIPSSFIQSFIRALDDVINGFNMRDLYYYDNTGKLIVNKELSKRNEIKFPVLKSEARFLYTVVEEDASNEVSRGNEYEGVAFIVNDYVNFAYITYDELRNMRDILRSTDMYNLSTNAAVLSSLTRVDQT